MWVLERFAALLALVLLIPLCAVISAAICVLSRQGPLVRHARTGWQGRPLGMLKFRTMWDETCAQQPFQLIEDVTGAPPTDKRLGDTRIRSPFAAWCRRRSIDEIPQLWHVVCGEMSLVGPRPITQAELETHYSGCMDEVLSLRPGLTGLWQIMGRSDLPYATRRRLDLLLVRKMSVSLYGAVLLRSVPCVIQGKGAA